jgi:hypothetical protein
MGKPRGIAIMLSAAAVAVAVAVGVGATAEDQSAPIDLSPYTEITRPEDVPADAPPWLLGLIARGDALNRLYGLGEYAPRCKPGDDLPGLKARSEALNRKDGLGDETPAAR